MKQGSPLPFLIIPLLFALCACSEYPTHPHYHGYMTKPYTIKGTRYTPMSVEQALTFEQTGNASHYNESSLWGMISATTAIGESIRPWHMQAAHPTLPLPCEVMVTNLLNLKSVRVRVNDRGPFINGRIIDLSDRAADYLNIKQRGVEPVHIQVLSVGDGKWRRSAPHE